MFATSSFDKEDDDDGLTFFRGCVFVQTVCSTVSGLEKLIVVQWSVMGGIHEYKRRLRGIRKRAR